MSVRRHYLSLAVLLIIGASALFAASALVFAQDRSHMDHAHAHGAEGLVPTMPGQEAFGTIQEIVRMLEADPATNWSKVNIGALREHLIDMDEVTMRARASERVLDMVSRSRLPARAAHSLRSSAWSRRTRMSWRPLGWSPMSEDLPNGVKLVVTAGDPRQVIKIKALGFMGIMVQGAHHQTHHLMMARGEFAH